MAKQRNALISDRPDDTVHQAKCAVMFIREGAERMFQDALTDNAAFGFYLILDCITEALEEAGEQLDKLHKKHRDELEKAKGGDHGG